MQGFKVKTPEEFDKAAQVPRAVPPNVLSRKFHLLASNLRSSMRTCSHIAAILLSQRAIDLPKDIENLLALEELMGNEPESAAEQPTEVNEHELEDMHATVVQGVEVEAESAERQVDEELPLDEMPDGVVDSVTARCAAAACVSDLGVVDFSDHGHVRAGTIKTRAYDSLREKMRQHLTDEQALLMTQVQPICKLQNATLYEGLALVSSGGELMLYRAILMDTGANCSIISIAVVRRLGLTVYEASTGAKVTRCDNSPTKFTHYCHVDVILAAGTPHMTLHRLHAFVTFEPENSWDLLIGTGPLKNSLMIDIKLGSGVAVSHAPSILGMNAQVVLPLVDMTPPRRPDLPRRVDPAVCLTTEIFGQGVACEWPKHPPPSAREERVAASGIRPEHIDDSVVSPLASPAPSPRELGELPRPRVSTHEELQEQNRHWTCPLDRRRTSSLKPLAPAVQAESERLLEQFYGDPIPWEGGRKLQYNEEKDRWLFGGSYSTHIPSMPSKHSVIMPKARSVSMLDLSMLQKLQDKVQALLTYPSGEVTGTLMWDLEKRAFCVQPSMATQYLDLMRCTLDHAFVFNGEELLRELQLPHWYESTGVWAYQLLRYLCPVDVESLTDGIFQRWARHGQDWLPLELVSLGSNTRYYPVEDGLGGPGRVFAENAAAQEYLRLGESRKMLKCVNTEQEGYAAIRADAARRPPPPHNSIVTKRTPTQPPAPAAGAGPSRATAGPSRATAGPSRARSLSPGRLARSRSPPRRGYSPTPSPASSGNGPVGNPRESSPPPAGAAAAEPSSAAAGPSRARSPPASPALSNEGSWANSVRVPRGARARSPGGVPSTPASPARTQQLSPSPTRTPPSPSGSDWSAVRNATHVSDRSLHKFLTAEEVQDLKSCSNLTVFMVKFGEDRCRNRRVMYELGVCYSERGLRLRAHPGISSKVARKHDKTISCGHQGWRLPLGGQTASSSLLEAVTSAYADLEDHGSRRKGQHARNVVGSLCAYVALGSAHVLCCMEHPHAKPVYYIFEDQDRCLRWRAQFTNEYLMRDDSKFTQLLWGTKHVAAPWVLATLESLEARLSPAAAPPALQARVAERPEHMDEIWTRNVDEVRDHPARQRRQPSGIVAERRSGASNAARVSAPSAGRHGTSSHVVSAPRASRLPANLTSRCPPSPPPSPPHSVCSAVTEAFEHHTQRATARNATTTSAFSSGPPGRSGRAALLSDRRCGRGLPAQAVHIRPGVLRACISLAGSAVVWWWLGRGPMPMVAIWAMLEAVAWRLSWCPFQVWWWRCVASLWDSLPVWWSIARRYPRRACYDVWVLWALAYVWYVGLLIVRTTGVYAGVHRVRAEGWTVVPLRGVVVSLACWSQCAAALLLVVLAWLWVCAGIYAEDVARHASYAVDIPLGVRDVRDGQGWTVPSLRWSQVFLLGRVRLPALPARLDKPRFAARWAQLRRNLQLHRVAQAAYLALVLALVVSTAAGGSSRLAHGGWRVMACFFASNSPVAAVRFNRILRFFLLLCGILWVAGKLTESMPAHGVMSPTRSAWGASPCTSWEAQQSSRQWEPGREANVAEQDEVLPYTVLDELQPLGDTTVTKDEAAWLDTELNATFGGHPDFKEEHWEEMRAVLRRCKSTFANSPHDLTGYKGKAEHNTFSIPFIDESKAAYQRPRKYSPGEQEIIDIHCKELLEYGFIEPAAKHCRHASNVVVGVRSPATRALKTRLETRAAVLRPSAPASRCYSGPLLGTHPTAPRLQTTMARRRAGSPPGACYLATGAFSCGTSAGDSYGNARCCAAAERPSTSVSLRTAVGGAFDCATSPNDDGSSSRWVAARGAYSCDTSAEDSTSPH
ncbi:hypothetical protein CYMTET_38050 [Cymbomonas tetramitiformis]|uniref:Uncharacterized protein n=1 Tax=Cymbomonas tetramitiformis TaxID=36881 RepID=A0AAE0F5V1_9CHLO|nr:hypothetical protein CYMTET_38050 [Cymbomonas tetramitiformis]